MTGNDWKEFLIMAFVHAPFFIFALGAVLTEIKYFLMDGRNKK